MRFDLKKLIKTCVEYMLWIAILLDVKSVYRNATEIDYHIPEIVLLSVIMLTFVSFLIYRVKMKYVITWICVMMPCFAIAVFYLIGSEYREYTSNFMIRFFVILPILSLFFCQIILENRFYTFIHKYTDVVVAISVFSLVFWLFGSQLNLLSPNGYVSAFWGTEYDYPSYYGLYFERQYAQLPFFTGLRNMGIYSEAHIFSLVLIISLAFEKFFKFKDDQSYEIKKREFSIQNIVLVVTIITTFSTTGYILLMVVYLIDYIRNHPELKKQHKYRFILGWIALALLLSVAFVLVQQRQSGMSYSIRMNDYYVGVQAWLSNPIFGTGYGDVISNMNSRGYSNSLFVILSQGGIILISLYLFPLIFPFFKKESGFKAMSVIVLSEIVLTIFQYSFLMISILSIMYGYVISSLGRTKMSNHVTYYRQNVVNYQNLKWGEE